MCFRSMRPRIMLSIQHLKNDFTSQSPAGVSILLVKLESSDQAVIATHIKQLNLTAAAKIKKINAERRSFGLVMITLIKRYLTKSIRHVISALISIEDSAGAPRKGCNIFKQCFYLWIESTNNGLHSSKDKCTWHVQNVLPRLYSLTSRPQQGQQHSIAC